VPGWGRVTWAVGWYSLRRAPGPSTHARPPAPGLPPSTLQVTASKVLPHVPGAPGRCALVRMNNREEASAAKKALSVQVGFKGFRV
jgi:hypothetical protein